MKDHIVTLAHLMTTYFSFEYLNSDHQVCHKQSTHPHNGAGHRHLHPQKPLVLCCQDDLCNYGAQQVQLRLDSVVQQHGPGHNRNDSSAGELPFSSLTRLLTLRYETRKGNDRILETKQTTNLPSDRSRTFSLQARMRLHAFHGRPRQEREKKTKTSSVTKVNNRGFLQKEKREEPN